MRRVESRSQIDLLGDLDKARYLAMGANECGVFLNNEIAINAELKRFVYARIRIAFDGKYWHIGKEIALPYQGSSYYPSVHDRWKSRDSAYRRGLRILRVYLGRVANKKNDSYGANKAAKQLLEKLPK